MLAQAGGEIHHGAVAVLDHGRCQGLGQEEHGLDVDGVDVIEGVLGDLGERAYG
jgi:hypothetical protein